MKPSGKHATNHVGIKPEIVEAKKRILGME